jgi:hypothetical protein
MAEENKKANNFSLTSLFQKIQVNCIISNIHSTYLKIWCESTSRPSSFLSFSKFLPRYFISFICLHKSPIFLYESSFPVLVCLLYILYLENSPMARAWHNHPLYLVPMLKKE